MLEAVLVVASNAVLLRAAPRRAVIMAGHDEGYSQTRRRSGLEVLGLDPHLSSGSNPSQSGVRSETLIGLNQSIVLIVQRFSRPAGRLAGRSAMTSCLRMMHARRIYILNKLESSFVSAVIRLTSFSTNLFVHYRLV